MFGLLVPLLDVLAILSDPEKWAESGQLPMHNLLLKSISKELVIVVQVQVRSTSTSKELDQIPCCNAFAAIVLMIIFVLQGFILSCEF